MRQFIIVLLIIVYNSIGICGYNRYDDNLTGDHNQKDWSTHPDRTEGDTSSQARNGPVHRFENQVVGEGDYSDVLTDLTVSTLNALDSFKTTFIRWFLGEPSSRRKAEPIIQDRPTSIDRMTYHEPHHDHHSHTNSEPYVKRVTGPLTGWMLGASKTVTRLKNKYYRWLFGSGGSSQVAEARQGFGGAPFAGSGAGGLWTGGLVSGVAVVTGGLVLHTAIEATGSQIDANEQIIADLQAQVSNLFSQLVAVNDSANACIMMPVIG